MQEKWRNSHAGHQRRSFWRIATLWFNPRKRFEFAYRNSYATSWENPAEPWSDIFWNRTRGHRTLHYNVLKHIVWVPSCHISLIYTLFFLQHTLPTSHEWSIQVSRLKLCTHFFLDCHRPRLYHSPWHHHPNNISSWGTSYESLFNSL
jgi:hypothetical protein